MVAAASAVAPGVVVALVVAAAVIVVAAAVVMVVAAVVAVVTVVTGAPAAAAAPAGECDDGAPCAVVAAAVAPAQWAMAQSTAAVSGLLLVPAAALPHVVGGACGHSEGLGRQACCVGAMTLALAVAPLEPLLAVA